MSILGALKGINGGYEINRVVGAFGGIIYTIGAHAFIAWDVMWKGRAFDLTEYCLVFPAGLAVVAGGTAGAIVLKDRGVAAARVIETTGATPGKGEVH